VTAKVHDLVTADN